MAAPPLQHFELQILLAMVRETGEVYSVPLLLAIEKRTGRRVAPAAVFITLSRLEKKGLVVSRLDEPDQGRVRRYFKITRQGIAAVKEQQKEHARLWRGMDRVLRARKT